MAVAQTAPGLSLTRDGTSSGPGLAIAVLAELERIVADLPRDRAGVRLHGMATLRSLFGPDGAIGSHVARRQGAGSRPVRAVLFDKSPAANWSLGWHQDRTICVRSRMSAEGFGAWTTKAGLTHAGPHLACRSGRRRPASICAKAGGQRAGDARVLGLIYACQGCCRQRRGMPRVASGPAGEGNSVICDADPPCLGERAGRF